MDTLSRRCLGLTVALWAIGAVAQVGDEDGELRIKAAFLQRFTGYIDWPELPAGDFQIGVLGSDAMLAELQKLFEGRRILERAVQVRRVRSSDALAGLQMLYAAGGEAPRLPTPRGLLLVTEGEGGLARGGVINFLLIERRVRFEIALTRAERAGLRLSSRLLAVALKVDVEGGN